MPAGPVQAHTAGLLTFEGDDVKDAVLTVREKDQITTFHRRRDVRDSQVIPGHVMDANRSSEHAPNRADNSRTTQGVTHGVGDAETHRGKAVVGPAGR